MTMTKNQQSKQAEELYIQVWRNPIFYGELFTVLSPEDWQTLTALAMFMDQNGVCYPSEKKLGQILGIKNTASVSRRIARLETKEYQNEVVLLVERGRKTNEKGVWVFANNKYYLNPDIVSIFNPHPKTLSCREEQMEKFLQIRQKLVNSFSLNTK
jgi:hypothetical protein